MRPWLGLLHWSVAAVGIGASVAAWQIQLRSEDEAARAHLARHGLEESMAIQQRLQHDLTSVEAVAAVFAASDRVSREQFQIVTDHLLRGNSALRALSWNPRVAQGERRAFEADCRAAGQPGCVIQERTPAGTLARASEREQYVVVRLIAPFEGNEPALGFDVASEPIRREALTRAARTGTTQLTGAIQLIQSEEAEPAVLAFHPVYARHKPASTPEERKHALLGFAVGVIQVADVVARALAPFEERELDLRVFDSSEPGREALLHTLPALPAVAAEREASPPPEERSGERFLLDQGFEAGGRNWRLAFSSGAALEHSRSWAPVQMLCGGLALTSLMVAYLAALSRSARRSQRMVEEQQRAATAVRESEARLRLVLDSTSDGWYEWDIPANRVDSSSRWLERFGWRREELEGHPRAWRKLVHPDDYDRVVRTALAHLKGEIPRYECEFRMRKGDGSYRWVLDRAAVVERAPDGRALRLLGTHTDIHERKEAEAAKKTLEAKLAQSRKLESLSVLAGGIAHDFNNLLVGILGNADLALSRVGGDRDWRHSLEEIQLAATRAAELTRQMLAYAGRAPLQREPVDLSRVVREVADALSEPVRSSLACELEADLPALLGDVTQIRQVVENLLENAVEALLEGGGSLRLRTRLQEVGRDFLDRADLDRTLGPGRFLVLEVRDSGTGMDRETRERIFDPFFSTRFQGRGLGLAAVLGIVAAHRGAIRVESEFGQGTRFTVLFPVGAASAAEATDADEPEALDGDTVLVVDDESAIRQLATRTLEAAGFRVLTARDGGEALELARAHGPALGAVVLDLTMPGLSGTETFRGLRSLSAAPVILSSGYAEEECLAEVGDDPPEGFLQKPYRAATLVETVRDALVGTRGAPGSGTPASA